MIDEEDIVRYMSVVLGLSKWSIRNTLSRLRLYYAWSKGRALSRPLIENYLFELGKTHRAGSVNTFITAFAVVEKYLNNRGQGQILVKGIRRLPVYQEPIDILTPAEIEKIVNTKVIHPHRNGGVIALNDQMYREFLMLLAYTGARWNEAASLQIKYVSIEQEKIMFVKTKNNVTRSVYIRDPLLSLLAQRIRGRDAHDLVFTTSSGKKVAPSEFHFNLKQRVKVAGIHKRVYPHLLRHSYATQLIKDGVPIETVAVILGHRDIKTTYSTYIHLADDTIKRAMFKHALVRKTVDPKEILKQIVETFESFKIGDDARFFFCLQKSESSITLDIRAK